jgi:hypothetical protein
MCSRLVPANAVASRVRAGYRDAFPAYPLVTTAFATTVVLLFNDLLFHALAFAF